MYCDRARPVFDFAFVILFDELWLPFLAYCVATTNALASDGLIALLKPAPGERPLDTKYMYTWYNSRKRSLFPVTVSLNEQRKGPRIKKTCSGISG